MMDVSDLDHPENFDWIMQLLCNMTWKPHKHNQPTRHSFEDYDAEHAWYGVGEIKNLLQISNTKAIAELAVRLESMGIEICEVLFPSYESFADKGVAKKFIKAEVFAPYKKIEHAVLPYLSDRACFYTQAPAANAVEEYTQRQAMQFFGKPDDDEYRVYSTPELQKLAADAFAENKIFVLSEEAKKTLTDWRRRVGEENASPTRKL